MFRSAAAIAVLYFVAVYAAPIELDEETKEIFAAFKTLDRSFLAEVQELVKNSANGTRAELQAQIDAKIATLPADQQELVNKVKTFFLSKQDAIKAKLQEKIAKLSPAAQELANKVLALASDATLTGNQIAEQVKALFAAASPEVQKELQDANAEVADKIKNAAENIKISQ